MRMRNIHLSLMVALTILFAGRVVAQLIQAIQPVGWLPSFEAWHGGALPYWALLSVQAAILAAMGILLWKLNGSRIKPRRWKYLACYAIGSVYFAVMGFRLVSGLTILSGIPWFAKSLPALFHLVLAAFVLLLGRAIHAECERLFAEAGGGDIGSERRHV